VPLVQTPYDGITGQIIGAAMAVHNELGPGYKERVYQEALSAKLCLAGLKFEEQAAAYVPVAEGKAITFYLDFLVADQVLVEIKALSHQLTGDELAQVINYLTALQLPVGLLVNFGRRRLEFKRVFPPKTVQAHQMRLARYHWEPKE
jgi:GxxExxY protein